MTHQFTNRQQQIVEGLIASGDFATQEAVLDEALELLQQRSHLRVMLQDGINDLVSGHRIPASEALRTLRSGMTAAE